MDNKKNEKNIVKIEPDVKIDDDFIESNEIFDKDGKLITSSDNDLEDTIVFDE